MNPEMKLLSDQLNNPQRTVTPVRVKRPTLRSANAWTPIRLRTGDHRTYLDIETQDQAGVVGPFNFDSSGKAVRKETLEDVEINDCRVFGKGRTWWLMRLYEVLGFSSRNTEYFHSGVHPTPPDGQKTEGHGLYISLINGGNLDLVSCNFHDMQGNGVQVVNRPSESVFPQTTPKFYWGVNIQHTHFWDCCQAEERGSFALAIYNPGPQVKIEDVGITYTDRFPVFQHGGVNYKSRGGILIGDAQRKGQTPQRTRFAVLEHVVIKQTNPLHPAMQFEGIDDLTVVRAIFEGEGVSKIVVDENCGEVWMKSMSGDVDIVIRLASGKMVPVLNHRGDSKFDWRK